ncbi:cob(I)yrinic acid a,c-diamide adenosyltransferase [Desulfococcus sp.]|uniref:cob(I)yrinic acid a,c-diamide adenosyltransferase n=1 Tax=Desulfococcus sp. TaxID=2025834 RepID=UPI0035947A68
MKIYTGGGDRGKTSLFSGERVAKSDARVEAYGEVDELNAILGALGASLLPEQQAVRDELSQIQKDLLTVGALLATLPDAPHFSTLARIGTERIEALETAMDRMDAQLPPLKSFILPGGSMQAAWAHVARTVCRRAERRIIRLEASGDAESPAAKRQNLLVYINRLSDYLFMLARHCNAAAGVEDILWNS